MDIVITSSNVQRQSPGIITNQLVIVTVYLQQCQDSVNVVERNGSKSLFLLLLLCKQCVKDELTLVKTLQLVHHKKRTAGTGHD